jgi:hypothetical protein
MLFQYKLLIILGLIVIGLIAVARIAHYWHPKPDPRIRIDEYTVVGATSGVTLQVRGGVLGRKTKDLILDGVIAPSKEPWNTESKVNLAKMAGTKVRVESKAGLFRSSDGSMDELVREGEVIASCPSCKGQELECQSCKGSGLVIGEEGQIYKNLPEEIYEAKTIHGKVFGESGCCLQLVQLQVGLAETIGKVPAEYAAAQKEAKKVKQGMWSVSVK